MAEPEPDAGRYSYEGLDRVLHEKARLGILTALVARTVATAFTELASVACDLVGQVMNLSYHPANHPDESHSPANRCRSSSKKLSQFYFSTKTRVDSEVVKAEVGMFKIVICLCLNPSATIVVSCIIQNFVYSTPYDN